MRKKRAIPLNKLQKQLILEDFITHDNNTYKEVSDRTGYSYYQICKFLGELNK